MAVVDDSADETEAPAFALLPDAAAAPPTQSPIQDSFRYAASGVWYFLRTQRNIRILFVVALLVIVAAAVIGVTALQWVALILAIQSVLAAEMVNTSVEIVLDLVHPERHRLAKAAKDIAAGAVLVTVIGSLAVGVLVFVAALR